MTTDNQACPECGGTVGIRWTGSTPSTDSWACRCGLGWAITVEIPALAAYETNRED